MALNMHLIMFYYSVIGGSSPKSGSCRIIDYLDSTILATLKLLP